MKIKVEVEETKKGYKLIVNPSANQNSNSMNPKDYWGWEEKAFIEYKKVAKKFSTHKFIQKYEEKKAFLENLEYYEESHEALKKISRDDFLNTIFPPHTDYCPCCQDTVTIAFVDGEQHCLYCGY